MTKRIDLIDLETGEIVHTGNGIQLPLIRTMYNYDRNANSRKAALYCKDPTRAQQQFKDDSNINNIVKRFLGTGELPQLIRPVYPEDYVEEVTDYQSAMNIIRRADEAFMKMPSGIRSRFQNNPQVFTEFFAHEANREEAEKMGLLLPRKPKEPEIVQAQGGDPQGDKKGVT